MKVLGVVANCAKDRAPAVVQRLKSKATQLGLMLLPDSTTATLMGITSPHTPHDVAQKADTVMVLGGDGSMLRTVRDLEGRDVPVIGVNLGSLGFMTSVTENDLERALECLSTGNYSTSLRTMLDCSVMRGSVLLNTFRALNETLITCGQRVGTLRMSVDGQEVGDLVCDGLIVSTATGSTGHSLSAGGPILMPTSSAMVVSFICPHTLSIRPLVISSGSSVEITVAERAVGSKMSVDGQVGQDLTIGDTIRVRKSPAGVRFVHLPGYDYFNVLRQKLHWRGSNV